MAIDVHNIASTLSDSDVKQRNVKSYYNPTRTPFLTLTLTLTHPFSPIQHLYFSGDYDVNIVPLRLSQLREKLITTDEMLLEIGTLLNFGADHHEIHHNQGDWGV